MVHLTTAPGNSAGLFVNGNPFLGIVGTLMTSQWANMVQGELVAVLAAAGISPDVDDNAQLVAAIAELINTSTGAVLTDALAPGALSIGDGVEIEEVFGVALDAAAMAGDPIRLRILGPVVLPKTSGDAIEVGSRLYWTGTEVTTTAGGNREIGVGGIQALAGSTEVTVVLRGIAA